MRADERGSTVNTHAVIIIVIIILYYYIRACVQCGPIDRLNFFIDRL